MSQFKLLQSGLHYSVRDLFGVDRNILKSFLIHVEVQMFHIMLRKHKPRVFRILFLPNFGMAEKRK
jgi:hypothetical protein